MDLQIYPWWLTYVFNNPLRRLLHNPEKILGDCIGEGDTVIDIGCGWGYFTIPMAKLVGEDGCVIGADIHERLLGMTERYAEREGLRGRVQLHKCKEVKIGIDRRVDFALAFYMIHEVSDVRGFLSEVASILKPDACFLVVEPKVRVTSLGFRKTVECAEAVGLKTSLEVKIRMSRAILLERS